MAEIALTIIGAVVLGVAVGIVAGLLGVGGGTVLLPAFRLLFGLSAVGSTATSLFTIIPTSVSGAVSHVRNKTCIPKLGIAMGVGGALTSWMGARLANISPSWCVMVAAAAAIGYSAVTMFRKALAAPKASDKTAATADDAASAQAPEATAGDGRNAGANELASASANVLNEAAHADSGASARTMEAAAAPSQSAGANTEEKASPLVEGMRPTIPALEKKHYAAALVIGAVAGLASGYIGLGGGFLMIPMMMTFLHLPMKLTSGTSLIAIMILAVPATVAQCLTGNVNLLVGIAVACGSIPGAAYGAKLTSRVPERTLRFAFAALLMFGAAMLLVKETGLLG